MSLIAPADVGVIRQPIADARRNVVGYELRFGSNGRIVDSGRDAKATSALLVDAFGDIGLDQLAGPHPAWVSIARDFLVEFGPPPLRPDRAVLQIAAYPAHDDLLGVLQKLGRSGYAIALTDYDGGAEDLLGLCSTVKIDVSDRDEETLRCLIAAPNLHGAVLVATGVGDPETFEACQALGFTYFQGSFFAQPRTVRHRSLATGELGPLRALAELDRPDITFEELERIIGADVGLSLKLLRYVNSAFFALPRTVGSVKEALGMLGARTVSRWAAVMAMSAIPNAPSDLVALALHRGRMCETLGAGGSVEEREGLFTVGMFSVADALVDAPMEQVLESLPFSDEIRLALLEHEGPKGRLLATVLAYEHGEFPSLPPEASEVSLAGAYREAVEWADQAGRALA